MTLVDDLADVILIDDDMKLILTDDANKEIPSKMTMHVTEFLTMQVAPSGGLSFQQMHMVPHV